MKKLNDSSATMFDYGELVRVSLKKFEKEEYSVENFKNIQKYVILI